MIETRERFAVVILHYNAIDDTIECIESVFKTMAHHDIEVVVIDNKSPNGSGEILRTKYGQKDKVHLIFSDTNLGFAKGNNLGYAYAKEKLNIDFMIIINNDTVINDSEFIDKALRIYKETGYAVLGPDILSVKCIGKSNAHQNPHRLKCVDLDEINRILIHLRRERRKLWVMKTIPVASVYEKLRRVKRKIIRNVSYNRHEDYHQGDHPMENVTLHGACLIYSPKFIERFDYAFRPEPFMYLDEDHLHYMCNKIGLKIIYDPSLKILHKEDKSTESVMYTSVDKAIFINKYMFESATLLKQIMMSDIESEVRQ